MVNKQEELAEDFIERYDADYGNAGQSISPSHKQALREGHSMGWTQSRQAAMEEAREKAIDICTYGHTMNHSEKVIKLSDLEKILLGEGK